MPFQVEEVEEETNDEEKTIAGEFAIGIIPADNGSFTEVEKNNLTVVYPEDGIPWVPEGIGGYDLGLPEDKLIVGGMNFVPPI